MNDGKPEASIGELISKLAHDSGVLMRQEVQLGVTEMTAKAKIAARNGAIMAIGGALMHAGLLVVLLAGAIALQSVLPLWAAALGIGLVVLGIGYGLVQKGVSTLGALTPVPKQTVSTLKADVVWAKEQVR